MRVVEYHSNSDIRIVEFPVPEIGPGELLVQLRACGLCASDVMEWYMQPRAPLYPGHEPVGVVVATGRVCSNSQLASVSLYIITFPVWSATTAGAAPFRSVQSFALPASFPVAWPNISVFPR